MNKSKRFEVVAHRGDRARYPENTLSAMRSALKKGCTFIECDVQLNAECNFYLLHDDNFKNTAGVKKNILEMTNSEVKAISVHEPKRFSESFKPSPVPHLKELLLLLQQFPHAKVMVEIKQHSIDKWGINKVMSLLLKQLIPFAKQCILISFNYEAVLFAQQSNELETGWVLETHNQSTLQKAHQLKPNYLIIDKAKIPANKVAEKGDWLWMLYGIKSISEAQNYATQGYYLMETDNICALMEGQQQEACVNGL